MKVDKLYSDCCINIECISQQTFNKFIRDIEIK